MKILKPLLVCSAAVVAAAALSGCQSAQSKTLSFQEMYKPTFSGLNGNAYMDYYYDSLSSDDREQIEKTLLGDVKTSDLSLSALSDYERAHNTVNSFLRSVSFSVSNRADKYSNGDTYKVTVEYNKNLAEVLNINVKDAEFTYTVKDLKEGTKIDPFEKVKVSFKGMSGSGEIVLDKSECPDFVQDDMYFTLENNYKLSNGDTAVLTANYSESSANSQEIVITQTTKEYKVSGLTKYANSLDGVDVSELQKLMDTKIAENIDYKVGETAYTSDYSTIDVTDVKINPYKKVFYNNNNPNSWNAKNLFNNVYEIEVQGTTRYASSSYDKVKYKKGQKVTFKVYASCYTSEIVLDENNKLILDDPSLYTSNDYKTYDDLLKRFQQNYSNYTITEVK